MRTNVLISEVTLVLGGGLVFMEAEFLSIFVSIRYILFSQTIQKKIKRDDLENGVGRSEASGRKREVREERPGTSGSRYVRRRVLAAAPGLPDQDVRSARPSPRHAVSREIKPSTDHTGYIYPSLPYCLIRHPSVLDVFFFFLCVLFIPVDLMFD